MKFYYLVTLVMCVSCAPTEREGQSDPSNSTHESEVGHDEMPTDALEDIEIVYDDSLKEEIKKDKAQNKSKGSSQSVSLKKKDSTVTHKSIAASPEVQTDTDKPYTLHENFSRLLKNTVTLKGAVDYRTLLTKKEELQDYIQLLSDSVPQSSWSKKRKMAYWINAYNAHILLIVLDHYPLTSINDIEGVWDLKFIWLGGKQYSLNQIEHEIIRKELPDPRVHFLLNCGAKSCPRLLNEAYTESNIESMAKKLTAEFVRSAKYNQLTEDKVKVSKLFDWYKADFERQGGIIAFLNDYSLVEIDQDATIEFLEYNWALNEK